MPPQLALIGCLIYVAWLFARDRRLRPMPSKGLWLPLLWFGILGSRSISGWFGAGMHFETPGDYVEGSPLDRNVFLALIAAGFVVLWRRRVDWGRFWRSNRWLCVFFLYCGVSSFWSDYAFVSFKRWIKDCGNIVMVLIILTESDPVQATRAVFARFAYLVLPFSVLLIKYYSDLGMYYNGSWEKISCGVTLEKNALGCDALFSGLFLVWDLLETRAKPTQQPDRLDVFNRWMLLFLVAWLFSRAKSSTSLALLILGICLLLCVRLPSARVHIRRLGTYSVAVLSLIVLLYSIPDIPQAFVQLLGRDMTLTGRTDIWQEVLKEPINPLIGTGYQSFWVGPRAQKYWDRWIFHPNQSHNGYIETYLNGGLVGLGILVVMIFAQGKLVKEALLARSGFSVLQFSFFIVTIFYNGTEAMFNKLSPAWFVMLLACVQYLPVRSASSVGMATDLDDQPERAEASSAVSSGVIS